MANSSVMGLDVGHPGTLPALNRHVVEACVRAGLALEGTIERVSMFDRKHYFYPDQPLGYQITQQRVPLVRGGRVRLGGGKSVRLNHIRIEQDSGKSFHDQHPTRTLVDYNRAGVGLLEIVSEPDMSTGEEAAEYLTQLSRLLVYLGVCNIQEMDASTFRCDVNVSVAREGEPLGTRVEVKNLNKQKAVRKAIEFEARRHIALLEAGRGAEIVQETRTWDHDAGRTFPLRLKESAMDYRYMPEPDLPPLVLDDAWVDALRRGLPELPDARVARFVDAAGLSHDVSARLVAATPLADRFDAALAVHPPLDASARVILADLLTNDLAGLLPPASDLAPGPQLAALASALAENRLSSRAAKMLLRRMVINEDARPPLEIAADLGWLATVDDSDVITLIDDVLLQHPVEVKKVLNGKDRLLSFLVGKVLQKSKGDVSPKRAHELVLLRISNIVD